MGRPKGTKNVLRPPEVKKQLIQKFYDSNQSKRHFAKSKGISGALFKKWVGKYEEDGLVGLKSRTGKHTTGNRFAALHKKKNLTEIERLRLENMKKDIEIACQKKDTL